jgi:hypothetical protein
MGTVRLGAARRALHGDSRCGDAYAWWNDGADWTLCLVDGLGHGPEAAEAAEAALAVAEGCRDLSPRDMLGAVDAAIRWSRGAAMGVVKVDAAGRSLVHAGIGNVRAALFGEPVLRFEGTPGIVGGGARVPVMASAAWRDGDMLLLWSDGFGPYLSLDGPSLRLKGDPEGLAAQLIERFGTGRDDAAVVCCLLEGLAP